MVQLEEYLERSLDKEIVEGLKYRVIAIFEYFKAFKNEDGLLENLESWVMVEWSKAADFVQNVNYPTNMLYFGALAAAGRIYQVPELLQESDEVRKTILKQSFNRCSRGIFI